MPQWFHKILIINVLTLYIVYELGSYPYAITYLYVLVFKGFF